MTRAASPRTRRSSRRKPNEPALAQVRIPYVQKGRLTVGGSVEEAFLVDLGISGAFIERKDGLPVGAAVRLEFPLPGNEIPVAVQGRVAWFLPPGGRLVAKALPSGLGVQFVEVSEWDRGRLRAFVTDYLARNTGRRFHRPLPLGVRENDDPTLT
jgi:Tfp pilus assembly protein PilZ